VRWEAVICQVDSWPPALERHFPQAPTRLVFEPTQGIEEVKADRLGDYHIQDAVGAGDADLQQSRDGAVQFVAEELALDKSRFLRAPRAGYASGCVAARAHDGDFELFETLLFEPGMGYYLVERHLQRLVASAVFRFPL
jgi:hypothetical protein